MAECWDLKNSKLISIASKSKEKIEKFKKKFNLNNIFSYNNYEEMLLNEKIDIVYIALPNNLHFEWIVKCINNKKNVLSEKPATVSVEEMSKINKKLDEHSIFFAEGFMYRFHPQTSALIEIIRQNEIGELHKMESFFGKNFSGENRSLFSARYIFFRKNFSGENRSYFQPEIIFFTNEK